MSNPYAPWVLGVGGGIALGLAIALGIAMRRENRMNAEGDRQAKDAGQPRDDESIVQFNRDQNRSHKEDLDAAHSRRMNRRIGDRF